MPTLWKYSPQSSLPSRLQITGELKTGKQNGRRTGMQQGSASLKLSSTFTKIWHFLEVFFFDNWFPLFPINRTECSGRAARRRLMVTCTERCWLVSTCRDVTGLWISLARALCGNIQNTEGCVRSVSKATTCHTQLVLYSIFHLFFTSPRRKHPTWKEHTLKWLDGYLILLERAPVDTWT